MSEWRSRVPYAPWRLVKETLSFIPDVRFHIEAQVWPAGAWEKFATIDMDVAGEGHGADVAREIVEAHNRSLPKLFGPPREPQVGDWVRVRPIVIDIDGVHV